MKPKDIIDFWFKETKPQQWFEKSAAFDRTIKRRFEKAYWAVLKGEMAAWRGTAEGRLAEIIVLDQFARNIFRGTPQSFAGDHMALALAQEAIRAGADKKLGAKKHFLYMPFMHAESKAVQKESVRLFKTIDKKATYAVDHARIINKFGRFPHRNAILGRKSTAAEKKFMQTHKGF